MSKKNAHLRPLLAALAMILGLLVASPARAQPSEEARESSKQAFLEARKLWDEGDFLQACAKFEESYQLAPSVGNLLNLGRCAERRGKLATAIGYFRRSAEMADRAGQAERAKAARDLLEMLEPRLSKVEITVEPQPDGLEVTLDGQPITLDGEPVALDPGEHRIAAYAPGYERDEKAVEVKAEGQLEQVALELVALPSAEDRGPGLMIAGIASAGVGAVGVVLGAVFGSMALGNESELEDKCVENTATGEFACPTTFEGEAFDFEALKDDARQNATVSTVGFAVGGALLGVGLTLILVDVFTRGEGPAPSDDVAVLPYVGPEGAGAGLQVRF